MEGINYIAQHCCYIRPGDGGGGRGKECREE